MTCIIIFLRMCYTKSVLSSHRKCKGEVFVMSVKTLQEFQTLTDTEHASVSSGGLGYYKTVIEGANGYACCCSNG